MRPLDKRKKHNTRARVSRILKRAAQSVFAVIFLVATAATIQAYWIIRDLPNPDRLTQRNIVQSTKILDRTGKVLLYEIYGEERRTVVPFNQIPDTAKWAAVAIEDANFYEHIGLDWKGIARAVIHNIRSHSLSQGGSTITQQLVKNSLLSSERTLTRKFKEAILSLGIETRYSKDQILELYLNQIPYGSNAYGIAAAADTFFGKTVEQLSLGEVALLSALPRAPTYYSPYGSHTDELFERKNTIIDRLVELNKIDREDANHAKQEKFEFLPPKRAIRAPHFVMYVREYLNEKYGEDYVQRGGLRVTTTLDWRLQEAAERAVLNGATRNEALVGAKNAALTAIDPKTGDVLAMVGSRDYFDIKNDGNVNVTTRARQPGSSFKPFVYAAAFEKGYGPDTVLFDVPTEFNTGCNPDGSPGPTISNAKECYHPKNYDNNYRGPVTLRRSLAQSLNVPSVKLLYLTGVKDAIKTAKNFGISTLKDSSQYGLTLVLGGGEVTLLEMTSAYGVFAQDGVLHSRNAIISVEDGGGSVLEEKQEITIPVIDTNIARMMNDVLTDNNARVPVFSPTSSLYFPNRQVAAKTGTTQNYRDAWVIGYTPSIVAGVWVGNNNNTPMRQEGVSVMVAGPIWHEFMEAALLQLPNERFTPPEYQTPDNPALRGMYGAGGTIKIDKISGKLATENTPPELIKEVSVGEPKTILWFVNKSDPLGSPPNNPASDPQYDNWQSSITAWAIANQLTVPTPPTEFDDIHTPEQRPGITLISPSISDTALPSLNTIIVGVTASHPLQEVTIFIDDELKGSKINPPMGQEIQFSLTTAVQPGEHIMKIVVYDTVGNTAFIEHKLSITGPSAN